MARGAYPDVSRFKAVEGGADEVLDVAKLEADIVLARRVGGGSVRLV